MIMASVPTTIRFTVPGVPVAQPRQRHRVLNVAGRTFAQNYTPKGAPVNAWKAAIQYGASRAYQGPPLTGALSLFARFVFPRPQSMMRKRGPNPRAWKTTKPDAENVLKALQDALSGLVFVDDAYLTRIVVEKYVASEHEAPHTEVEIAPLAQLQTPIPYPEGET